MTGSKRQIVERCLSDDTIQLLVPQELLQETQRVVAREDYLRTRITLPRLQPFIEQLAEIGDVLPELTEPQASLSRDPDDDYLVAYGLAANVDYLITGDKDLLVIEKVHPLLIKSVQEFVEILNASMGQ